MNPDAFTPSNPLEEALRAAALDPTAMSDFVATLTVSELIVPVRSTAVGGEVEVTLLPRDGIDHVPAFTSALQYARGDRTETSRIALTGRGLAAMWPRGTGLAINPRADLGFAMPPSVLDVMRAAPARASEPRTLRAGARLAIGEPAAEPQRMLDRVRAAAGALPHVLALHRALVVVRGDDETPFIAIGVQLDPDGGAAELAVRRLAEAAGPEAAVLAIHRGDDGPLADYMLERDDPFYRGER